MKNYIATGDTVDYVAGATIASGDLVQMGTSKIPGIATISGISGDVIPVKREGVYALAKATGTAWTQMVKLYWDASAANATPSSASGANAFLGYAFDSATSGATSGNVLLGEFLG